MEYEELLKKKRPELSDTSIKTYASILNNLKASKNQIFKKPNEVIDMLKGENISTKKTTLSALYVLTDYYPYKEAMILTIKEYNKLIDTQEPTEKEKKNWVTMDAVKELFDSYKNKIPQYYKTLDYQSIQDFIILSLMSGIFINPRRLKDYTHFKIKNIDGSKDNFLSRKKLYFNVYKGSDSKGLQVIPIPDELNNILRKWISINPTDYLLFNHKGAPLSSVVLNQRLNKIFKSKVGVNALRHSFLTTKHADTVDKMDELKTDMKMMGSSILQAKLYIKKLT